VFHRVFSWTKSFCDAANAYFLQAKFVNFADQALLPEFLRYPLEILIQVFLGLRTRLCFIKYFPGPRVLEMHNQSLLLKAKYLSILPTRPISLNF